MPAVQILKKGDPLTRYGAFDLTTDLATVGFLSTISYIAFAAGSPGWMVFGAFMAFAAITSFIDFLIQFF